VSFAGSRHAFVVVRSELPRRRASAFATHNRRRRHLRLLDEIVGQGKCGAEIFTAMRRAILGKIRCRLKGKIGIGDQFSKSQQRSAVRCHTSTVRRDLTKSKRKLFSDQRRFQTLPERTVNGLPSPHGNVFHEARPNEAFPVRRQPPAEILIGDQGSKLSRQILGINRLEQQSGFAVFTNSAFPPTYEATTANPHALLRFFT
jgi:hypothetical protein